MVKLKLLIIALFLEYKQTYINAFTYIHIACICSQVYVLPMFVTYCIKYLGVGKFHAVFQPRNIHVLVQYLTMCALCRETVMTFKSNSSISTNTIVFEGVNSTSVALTYVSYLHDNKLLLSDLV